MQKDNRLKLGSTLKRYIQKGIPSVYRVQVTVTPISHPARYGFAKMRNQFREGKNVNLNSPFQVWSKISGVDDMKFKYGSTLYRDRLNVILDSDIVQAIRIDLPRTFPENIYFQNSKGCQDQLYRVLFAFAADNPDIGYCQVSCLL